MYAYAGNNPIKYTDPDGNEQTPFQKALTAELSKLSKSDNGFVKEGVKIIIQRSWNDNGENGTYYQSKMSITYNGASLNEVSVQSTPDWQNELKRGNGERIPSGEYTGVLQKRSGKYSNAINLQASFIIAKDIFIHPNVMSALGETEPYGQGKQKGRPFSLGCQITNLSDFNELTDILNALGFNYGEGEWGTGDSVRVEIKPAKNWAMMENQ